MAESGQIAKRGDWRTEPLPTQHSHLRLDRVYTPEEMDSIRRGFLPEVMEDKWFIFYEDDVLYCHRSWTGYLVYQAGFKAVDSGSRVTYLKINCDPEQYRSTDDLYEAQLFLYLVDLLLLGKRGMPPQRDGGSADALDMWAQFGRGFYREEDYTDN